MRKSNSLKLLLSALLMAIGCNAWGATSTFSYESYKGQGTSSTGSAVTFTQDNITIADNKGYGSSSAAYCQFYAGGTTTITPGSGVTITSIVITATDKADNRSGGTWKASIGGVEKNEATITWTGSATGAFTLEHESQLRWTSIVVTYSSSSSTPYTVTFNVGSGSFKDGETFDAGTTNKRTEASAGAGVTLPDVDANDGFKFLGWTATEGKTTIDAGLTAGATYKPSKDIELYAVYGTLYQVTIVNPANGTLSVKCGGKDVESGEYYAVGEVLNIVATHAEGYKFRNIQVVDASTHTYTASNKKDWTMGEHAITIKANFDEIVYRTITWSVNGNTSVIEPSKVEDGTNITFPTGLEDILGKKFMGWSANSAANSANDLVSGDIAASESTTIFYAVYADLTPGTQETATLTITDTETCSYTDGLTRTDDKENNWVSYACITNQTSNKVNYFMIQINKNSNGYYIGSPDFGNNISSISAKVWNTNSSERYAYLKANTETKQPSTSDYGTTTVSGNSKGVEVDFTINTDAEFSQFYIYSSGALGFEWIKVTYGTPDTYSNYTTTIPLSGTIDFRASDESGAYWATYSGAYNVVIPAEDENAVYNVYAVAYENEALVMFDFASDFNNVDAQSNPIVPANVGVLVKAVAKPEKTVSALTYTYSAAAGENYDAECNSLHPASEDKEGLKENHKFYMLARDANRENIGFYYGAADGGVFTSREGSAYLAVPKSALAPARFVLSDLNDKVPTAVENSSLNTEVKKVIIDGQMMILRDGNLFDLNGRLVK